MQVSPNVVVYDESLDLNKGRPNVGQFVDPPVDAQAEFDSFNFQSDTINIKPPPPDAHLKKAIHVLESLYGSGRYEVPDDFASKEHITRVVELVAKTKGKKSPGALFQREGLATNEDVFRRYGVEGIVEQVSDRIADLLNARSDEEARQISDPLKVFVKRQSVRQSKAQQKRWRLVYGMSLIDQCVDRVLYQECVDKAIAMHEHLPSKPGINFKAGGLDRMVRKYQVASNYSKKWKSFDCSGFDLSAPAWALRAVRDLNNNLAHFPSEGVQNLWELLSHRREEAALYGSFAFSDGTLIVVTFPCIQRSGRLLTIDSNCKMMSLFRTLYDTAHGKQTLEHGLIAMGDDTVQDGLDDPDHFVAYQRDVHGVKYTVESETGPFEAQNFCSFDVVKNSEGRFVPVPRNWDLNIHALCHPEKGKQDVVLNQLQSLCTEYVYHPRFSELHNLLWKEANQRGEPSAYRSKKFFIDCMTGYESSSVEPALPETAQLGEQFELFGIAEQA